MVLLHPPSPLHLICYGWSWVNRVQQIIDNCEQAELSIDIVIDFHKF